MYLSLRIFPNGVRTDLTIALRAAQFNDSIALQQVPALMAPREREVSSSLQTPHALASIVSGQGHTRSFKRSVLPLKMGLVHQVQSIVEWRR